MSFDFYDLNGLKRYGVAQELAYRDKNELLVEGQVNTATANKEALARLVAHAEDLEPLLYLVTEDIAAAVEPALMAIPMGDGDKERTTKGFQRKTRQTAYELLEWFQQNQNWTKSKSQAVRDLGISMNEYWHIIKFWPHFWSMLNILVQKKFRNEEALVDLATLDAAIQGNDRDRRLYYELRGRLRKDPGDVAKATLIFINDSVQRPPSLLQRLEPLPGPFLQRLEPLPEASQQRLEPLPEDSSLNKKGVGSYDPTP